MNAKDKLNILVQDHPLQASTITSLAILKANWDNLRRDYTDNFVPVIADCIRQLPSDVVSTPELQAQLQLQFGLTLPHHVINSILRRVCRAKYIYRQHGAYYRDDKKLSELNFHSLQQDVVMKHENLVRSFIDFCRDFHDLRLDNEQAESALLAYIEDNQISIIGAKYRNSVIPHVDYPSKSSKYLVASFVKYLQETHSSTFDHFETIVKGNMLANAVFLPDNNHTPKKFRQTEVYLDTSFILYAIGHAGEPRQAPCLELIQLLKDFGATLRCFTHNLDECRGILDACARKIGSGQLRDAYGPSILYFVSKKYSATDIILFAERLESDINKLGITVVAKPEYKDHEYIIDETELEQVLNQPDTRNGKSCLRQEVYRREVALRRDVESVSAIMRLRRGRIPIYYEDYGALFVTTNTHVTSVSQKIFYKDAASDVIPPCQTDFALTNILWLKQPTKAPSLPRKRIIADYYASMQPSDRLWRSYTVEIDKQESEKRLGTENYYILRYSLEAKQALMDITLGDEDAFSQGSVAEILDLAKEQMTKERDEKLQSQISEKNKSLESANIRVQASEMQIIEADVRERQRLSRIKQRSERVAKIIGHILLVISLLLVAIGTYFTFPWSTPKLDESPLRYGVAILLALLFILSVFSMIFGTRVLDLVRFVEKKMAIFFELLLLKLSQ